jgi:hypothetical protein
VPGEANSTQMAKLMAPKRSHASRAGLLTGLVARRMRIAHSPAIVTESPARAHRSPPMSTVESLAVRSGIGTCRPRGRHSLVEAVDLVSRAIAQCRAHGVDKLLVDSTGLVDLPVPTLLERFLMVEDWAQVANGTVAVAMVALPEYIHPRKFGVKVAEHFGLVCNVHTSEEDALAWLADAASTAGSPGGSRAARRIAPQ